MKMHKWLGVYKVPFLTLLTAAIIYGLALVVVASNPADRNKQVACCIVIWVFSTLLGLIVYRWVYYVLSEESTSDGAPLTSRVGLWALFDVFLATYHILAALGFSIWLMDASIGKDSYFIGITVLDDPYAVYVGDFLMLSVTLFNSAGFSVLRPRASTPLAAMWTIVVSLCGVLFIGLLLNFLLSRRPHQQKQQKQQNGFYDTIVMPAGAPFVNKNGGSVRLPRYSSHAQTNSGIRPRVYKKHK